MRLWSLHPSYLDSKGLVALWREALLAQAVLAGKTKGYTEHPQLERFKAARAPLKAIGQYLHHVLIEAQKRGYHFDGSKILNPPQRKTSPFCKVRHGQIDYEWQHLCRKLKSRDPKHLKTIKDSSPKPHPSFMTAPGAIESWERLGKQP